MSSTDEIAPILKEVSRTIDQVLNGMQPVERRWAYVVMVAPFGGEPPIEMEVLHNVTDESLRLILREAHARAEGRLSHDHGHS